MSELPSGADVVVIGCGFAGAATAWALRRLGADVIVLERELQLGRFASGRSAGLGRQLADDDHTTALTVRGAAVLRSMPVWAPTGGVLSFDDEPTAIAYLERARRHGIAVEPSGRELVAQRWPQLAELRVTQALWVPSDGTIDVAALLALFTANIRVELGAGVVRIDPGERPRVITTRGELSARIVVDAGGAWAGETTGGEPLSAFKRHVFILGGDVAIGAPWIWHLGAGELYMRGVDGGVLASPCDSAPGGAGHQDADLVGEEHLRRLLGDAESPLAAAPITRRWACQRAFTEDRKMRLGRDDRAPWLVWAAGLGGHGATASPAVGERVAEAVIAALR